MIFFDKKTFQGLILILQKYWFNKGCDIIQPLDIELGAGTSHPMTCLKAIGPEPNFVAYVQASRRPCDGYYGSSRNKLQKHYQFQVVMKPPVKNIQKLYIDSLKYLGIDLEIYDLKFIEDNWKNPTLGAYGVGWEVRLNSVEITQFTYFQQMGGLKCDPITGEITYGLERLAMHIQDKKNVYEVIWNNRNNIIKYGDMFLEDEIEKSKYNFEYANTDFLFYCFNHYIKEAINLISISNPLPLVAYELILKAIYNFNILESRKFFSTTERQSYIIKINNTMKILAKVYFNLRKSLGFPLCKEEYEK